MLNNKTMGNKNNRGADSMSMSIFEDFINKLNTPKTIDVTPEAFVDKLGYDYGKSLEEDLNKKVGQITISSNNFNAIMLLPDKKFAPLARKALEVVLGDREGFGTGTGKYYGLFMEDIKADNINIDYVTVDTRDGQEDQELVIKEILACDLNDVSNLRKIFNDINDLFRMYQERTIDAAKKLYVVLCDFYTDIIKAKSTKHIEKEFTSFKDFKVDEVGNVVKGLEITRPDFPEYMTEKELGDFVVEMDEEENDIAAIYVNDTIGDIQDKVAAGYEQLINDVIYKKYLEVEIDQVTEATFGLGSDLNDFAADMYNALRRPYSKIIAWAVEESNKVEEALKQKRVSEYAANKRLEEIKILKAEFLYNLSSTAREMTKHLSMAEAGKLMFMIANIKKIDGTWIVDKNSTNQLHLAVAPELFAAYLTAEHAQVKVCGYPVLGNIDNLNIGDKVEFINGNNSSGIYLDSNYTGTLEIQKFDEKIYAVKPIEFKRVETKPAEEITIIAYENSVINAVEFAKTKTKVKSDFITLKAHKVFSKAEKIQLVPFFSYKDRTGKTQFVPNAIVCTIPSAADPAKKFEIPVAQYQCKSAEYEQMIAGIYCRKLNNLIIDEEQHIMHLTFSTEYREDVPMNNAKIENDVFTDINNNWNDPSVIVNKQVQNPFIAPELTEEEVAFGENLSVAGFDDEAFGSYNAATYLEEF